MRGDCQLAYTSLEHCYARQPHQVAVLRVSKEANLLSHPNDIEMHVTQGFKKAVGR